jgi:predicted flap endonuclease-1-like 5' DNA nuclease
MLQQLVDFRDRDAARSRDANNLHGRIGRADVGAQAGGRRR